MNCDICLCGTERGQAEQELSHEEAMNVCEQIKEMGVKRAVLTGGEPLMREDWAEIAFRLTDGGVEVHIITNGYFLDKETVRKIKKAGIKKVTVSIDGTEAAHDSSRIRGSYARCVNGVKLLRTEQIPFWIATTVTKDNLSILPGLAEELLELEAEHWSIQAGLPFGNMKKEKVLSANEIEQLIDICHEISSQSGMKIYLGESIGYYSCKEALIRSKALGTDKIPVFRGCPAGITTLDIACNGDILGISLCVSGFREGSLRERTLREIWEDPNAFSWRRNMTAKDLKGACAGCTYGELCMGGCPAVRYSLTGDIFGENQMCIYGGRNAG